jgi:hypothetical protein
MQNVQRHHELKSPRSASNTLASPQFSRFVAIVLVLVFLVYAVQIAGPLRLTPDAIVYLLQAGSAADGHGFRVHGERSKLPAGYPALIFLLIRSGLGLSWAIIALNCVLLAAGLWATHRILRRFLEFETETATVICVLTILSYITVKHVTYPLSDISFFSFSLMLLWLLLGYESGGASGSLVRMAAIFALLVFCIQLRTVGIALLPPVIWVMASAAPWRERGLPWLRRHYRVVVVISVLAVLVLLKLVMVVLHTQYMQENLTTFRERGVLSNLLRILSYRTLEWGQLTINAPVNKLPNHPWVPMQIVGLGSLFLWLIGLWHKRKTAAEALVVYLLTYTAILFLWSSLDPRFWLPVIPLLIAYALIGLKQLISARKLRPMLAIYSVCFCALGAIALGYSTRLTFAGSNFGDLYRDGEFRGTYRAAFQPAVSTDPSGVNPDGLYLLRRYDWRLARSHGAQ